jgi:hypothetical protein
VLSYADRRIGSGGRWDFSDVFEEATFVAVPLVGFILTSRRPVNRVGWIFLGAGLVVGLGFFCDRYGRGGLAAAAGSLPAARAAAWFANWAWTTIPAAGLAFILLLFDRAAVLAALAPGRVVRGRVVRGRGVHAGCGRGGGTRLPRLGGPVHCAR